MDYLVQVLNSRSLNGDVNSTSGLNIDDELKNIHIVKNISLNGFFFFNFIVIF